MNKNNFYKFFLAIAVTLLIASLIIFFNMSKVSNKSKEIDQAWVPSMEVLGWLNGAVSDVPSLAPFILLWKPTPNKWQGLKTKNCTRY